VKSAVRFGSVRSSYIYLFLLYAPIAPAVLFPAVPSRHSFPGTRYGKPCILLSKKKSMILC